MWKCSVPELPSGIFESKKVPRLPASFEGAALDEGTLEHTIAALLLRECDSQSRDPLRRKLARAVFDEQTNEATVRAGEQQLL